MALPKIQAVITADTKQAEAGIKRVSDGIGDVEGASKKAMSAVKAFAAGLVSIAAVGTVFSKSVAEAQKFETTMFRIQAVIKATGGAAGRTAQELRSFAENLALNTLESTEGVLEAQQRLLTFRKVSGDVFDRTIAVAADLSAVLGQSMSGAAIQLGRALEDPATGLSALTRTGTVFTDSQKEMVKQLVESGKLMEAQSFILDELEAQYGGAAVAAAQGYAGALDTLGQRIQEFFLSVDENLGLTKALSAVYLTAADAIKFVTDNMARLVAYIGTAAAASAAYAAFMARGWVAAFVAARVATFSLAAALTTLRTALIRTGIGAVVVLAGEAVYQFTRLTSAVGSIGEAMGLLGDVAVEVWGRIKDGASAMVMSIKATFLEMEGSFLGAISRMALKASDFFMSMSEGVANIPGMEGLAGGLMSASDAFLRGAARTSQAGQTSLNQAEGMRGEAAGLFAGLGAPLESVQKIKDLLASIKDERITLPDLLGAGTDADGEGGGKGGKSASEKLDEELTAQEERIKTHFDRIKALTEGGLSDKLGAWGNYFSGLISLTGSNNQKLLAAQKTFVAAQALIDAFGAYNKVLNDPTPQPWWARLAAAGQVFAAGIGAVNAIKSASASGGSTSAPSASAASSTAAAPAMPTQTVAINLQGDTFSRSSVEGLLEQIQSQLDRGGRLVFQ